MLNYFTQFLNSSPLQTPLLQSISLILVSLSLSVEAVVLRLIWLSPYFLSPHFYFFFLLKTNYTSHIYYTSLSILMILKNILILFPGIFLQPYFQFFDRFPRLFFISYFLDDAEEQMNLHDLKMLGDNLQLFRFFSFFSFLCLSLYHNFHEISVLSAFSTLFCNISLLLDPFFLCTC